MTALWTARAIAAATGGTATADFTVNGVAFDSREVTKGDLAEPQIVGDEAFRLLINALLIARYGEDALRIASQQGQREFIKRRAFRRGGFLPAAPLTGR